LSEFDVGKDVGWDVRGADVSVAAICISYSRGCSPPGTAWRRALHGVGHWRALGLEENYAAPCERRVVCGVFRLHRSLKH